MNIVTHVQFLKAEKVKLTQRLGVVTAELDAIKSALSEERQMPRRVTTKVAKPARRVPLDGQTCNEIVAALAASPTPLTRKEIEAKVGMSTVGAFLSGLVAAGRVSLEKQPRSGRAGRAQYLYSVPQREPEAVAVAV